MVYRVFGAAAEREPKIPVSEKLVGAKTWMLVHAEGKVSDILIACRTSR